MSFCRALRRFRGTAIFALVALVTLFRLLVRVVRAEGALLAAIFLCKFILVFFFFVLLGVVDEEVEEEEVEEVEKEEVEEVDNEEDEDEEEGMYLECAGSVQEVGGLQVTMEYPVVVQVLDGREQLRHQGLDLRLCERLLLLVQDVLQVVRQQLHHHEDAVEIRRDHHLLHIDNVRVVDCQHDVHLPQRRDRKALPLPLHLDLLQGNNLAGHLVLGLVDRTEGPLPKLELLLKALHRSACDRVARHRL